MSDPGTEATNRKYSELVGFDLTCLYRNLPFSSCLLKNLFVVTQRPLLRNLSILPYFGGCVTSNLKLIFQAIKEKCCTITISYEFIIRFNNVQFSIEKIENDLPTFSICIIIKIALNVRNIKKIRYFSRYICIFLLSSLQTMHFKWKTSLYFIQSTSHMCI